MSETGRPRRSAATHSSKVWAPLMSNKSGGEDDVYDEPTETTRKRTNSTKSPGPRTGRGKKAKISESAADEIFPEEPVAPPPVPEPVIASASPKAGVRSPKKAPVKKGAPIVTSDAADLQRMQEDFDRQNVIAPVDDELEEEEVSSPPVVKPAKSRGRPAARPLLPPSLTGMDDPKDADYVMEEPEVKKRAPPPRPRINVPPPAGPRTIVMRAPPPRQTAPFRPGMTVAPRVVFPNRLPTIINGGPRVVQPRYVSRPVANTDVLTKPLPVQNYDLPVNVIQDIERLTKEVKDSGNPTVMAAFELVQIVREELDRAQKLYNDANHFYQDYVERLQTAAISNEEQSTKRISFLEGEVNALRSQLKKCSAIAHQKLLKAFEESQQSPQKLIPTSQYVVMAEQGALEQPHPTNYLVQEEEYVEQPGAYYTHEAVIQEASKEVDNMV